MHPLHAFLPPSAAGRWDVCALSAALEEAYPDSEESPESLEGTAAHWVVQRTLESHPPAIDTQAPNGVAVTREMLEGAELVVETLEQTLGPDWRSMLVIERRVQIPTIHPSKCWGTPDYYAWVTTAVLRVLFLFDYKFGHGIVEVRDNKQLTAYASGLIDEKATLGDQPVKLVACLIQPRSYHRDGPVRFWHGATAQTLRPAIEHLRVQAAKATSPNPEAVPDPDACKNCRGRHACEALQREAYQSAAKGQQAQAIDLSPHALGLELRALTRAQALLNARVSGLTAQVESTVRRGGSVPFWSMEATVPHLKWKVSQLEVLALGEILGKDFSTPPGVITPVQAKNAGMPESLVTVYASRPAGTVKLVLDNGEKARLTFTSSAT